MRFMIPVLIGLFVMGCMGEDDNPSGPAPSGKMSSQVVGIEWECGQDSTWSVFNGGFVFSIDRQSVSVREHTGNAVYTHRSHDAAMLHENGGCYLYSSLLSSYQAVRIFRGHVWRDAIHRYYVQEKISLTRSIPVMVRPTALLLRLSRRSGIRIFSTFTIGASPGLMA